MPSAAMYIRHVHQLSKSIKHGIYVAEKITSYVWKTTMGTDSVQLHIQEYSNLQYQWSKMADWFPATSDKWVLSLKYPIFAGSIHKMTCCRCNRNGACQSCVCAQEGKFCTDCLPKRLESCQNIRTEAQAYTVKNQPDQAYTYHLWIRSRWECNDAL